MAGASIFVMYADGNGNITLSGRKGTGQVEPKADSTLQAGLELLEGTGIANGMMVANVRCTSCTLDSDKSSSDSPWIAAWSTGSAIDSTSTSATIRQHSGNNRVEAQVDLSQASIASDANPFLSSSTPSDSTGSGSSSPTTASSSKPTTGSGSNGYGHGGFGPGSNDDDDDDDDDDADDDFRGGNGNGNSGVTFGGSSSFQTITDYQKAHGIVMGIVVVLLFPFGAMFMRMGGSGIVHGILQVLSLCALLVGLGLGVKLADLRNMVRGSFSFSRRQFLGFGSEDESGFGPGAGGDFGQGGFAGRGGFQNLTTTHPLFGIILVALFLIQPIFGLIHHIQYKRNLSRAGVSHLHIWYGRILMLLAIINGGLGLQLANNSRNGKIAYAVVAAVVGVVYIAMCVFKRKGSGSAGGRGLRSGRTRGLRKEESAGSANGEGHALPAYAGTPPEGHYGGRTVFK